MAWHLETWQRALDLALLIVMSLGFGAIVVAVRGPRRVRISDAQRRNLGVGGGVVFAIGFAARLLFDDVLAPVARPVPASPASSQAPAEVVDERTFESAALPALRVDAPEGWRVALDPDARRVTVADAAGTAPAVLFTRRIEEAGSAAGVRAELRRQLEASSVQVSEFDDTIAGAPARGLAAKVTGAANASFCVDRRDAPAGARLVTVIQCRAPEGRDARTACRPVLDRLRWVVPAG